MHQEEVQANLPALPPSRRHQQCRRPDELFHLGSEHRVAGSGVDMESGANFAYLYVTAFHYLPKSGGKERVRFVGCRFEDLRVINLTQNFEDRQTRIRARGFFVTEVVNLRGSGSVNCCLGKASRDEGFIAKLKAILLLPG